MDEFNTISLTSKLEQSDEGEYLTLTWPLRIDGQEFHPEHTVDIAALAKSYQLSGEFYIFSCGCGVPECAGIEHGIQIEQLDDAIVWRFYDPINSKDYFNLSDEEFNAIKQYVEFRFDQDRYLANIEQGINQIKALAVSENKYIAYPIMNCTLDWLIGINPRVFSSRLAADKRVTAKQITVDAYHQDVYVGSLYYKMDWLNLPAALTVSYQAWQDKVVFPQNESELPAYLDYLKTGREFCHALKQYLGNDDDLNVKLRYHPPDCYNSMAWEVVEDIR